MKQFFLTEITTKDNLIHQGIYFEPKKKHGTAIVYVHGLSSTFYSNVPLLNTLVEVCAAKNIGFASFNNRGHDVTAGIKKLDPTSEKGYTRLPGGASQEVFTESVHDIDAGVSFLYRKGYKNIILIGHSSGANKACYYCGTQQDLRVKGVILSSPVSDRYAPFEKTSAFSLFIMKVLKALGFGNTLLLWPTITTPNRFLSLKSHRTAEDTFNYGDNEPKLSSFSKITLPLLVVLGSADEYLDRSAESVIKEFDAHEHAKNYKSILIPEGLHSYIGQEKLLAKTMIDWITSYA